jgi:hypothetical protein
MTMTHLTEYRDFCRGSDADKAFFELSPHRRLRVATSDEVSDWERFVGPVTADQFVYTAVKKFPGLRVRAFLIGRPAAYLDLLNQGEAAAKGVFERYGRPTNGVRG